MIKQCKQCSSFDSKQHKRLQKHAQTGVVALLEMIGAKTRVFICGKDSCIHMRQRLVYSYGAKTRVFICGKDLCSAYGAKTGVAPIQTGVAPMIHIIHMILIEMIRIMQK